MTTKPSPQQICDAMIVLEKAGVDLSTIRNVAPSEVRRYKFELGGSYVFYFGDNLGSAIEAFIKDHRYRVAEITSIAEDQSTSAGRENMQRYLDLTDKVRELQAEYDKKVAELDPLRWKLTEAKVAADAEWKRMRG